MQSRKKISIILSLILLLPLVQLWGQTSAPLVKYDTIDEILNHEFETSAPQGNDGYLYNFIQLKNHPLVIVDFNDCNLKVRMLHRVYVFAEADFDEETLALYPDRIVPPSMIKSGSTFNGFKNNCGSIDGHDYNGRILADFFSLVWTKNMKSFEDEIVLLNELFSLGVLTPVIDEKARERKIKSKLISLAKERGLESEYYLTHYNKAVLDDNRSGLATYLGMIEFSAEDLLELTVAWEPAEGMEDFALISIDQVLRQKIENGTEQESISVRVWRRLTTLTHEILHAYFFNNADYRERVGTIWQTHVVDRGEKITIAQADGESSEVELLYKIGAVGVFYGGASETVHLNEFQSFTGSQGRDLLFWNDEMVRRKWLGKDHAIQLTELISKHYDYVSIDLRQKIRQALIDSGYQPNDFTISQDALKLMYATYDVPSSIKVQHIFVGYDEALAGKTGARSFEAAERLANDYLAAWTSNDFKDLGAVNAFVAECSDDEEFYSRWVHNFGIDNFSWNLNHQMNRSEFLKNETGLDYQNFVYEGGPKTALPFQFFDAYSQFIFTLDVDEVKLLETSPDAQSNAYGFYIVKRVE